jgi:hypothetical protein
VSENDNSKDLLKVSNQLVKYKLNEIQKSKKIVAKEFSSAKKLKSIGISLVEKYERKTA